MQANYLNLHPIIHFNPAAFNTLLFESRRPQTLPNIQSLVSPIIPFNYCLNLNQSQNYPSFPLYTHINHSLSCDQGYSPSTKIKEEESLKFEFSEPKIEEDITIEKKEEESESFSESLRYQNLFLQTKEMLMYILNNFEQIKGTKLDQRRSLYASNLILLKLFDTILERYTSTLKTRDEILKYITRKAFATIGNSFTKKHHLDEVSLSEALCRRYFKTSIKEIEKLGISIKTRENFLRVLFPYRKNCKNTQKYKKLIAKLGCSIEFYEDYCMFLRNFQALMKIEKERKIDVFVSYLCSCVEKDRIDDILYYKRAPWLNIWMEQAYIMAQEISVALKVRASGDFEPLNKTKRIQNCQNEKQRDKKKKPWDKL